MKIILAKTAGFCMGVRRAMEIAVDAVRSDKAPIRTQGPIIHNQQAVNLLEARGISSGVDAGSVEGGSVIIRAHGITPDEKRQLFELGVELIDATCPHVLLSQKRIEKASGEGREIVLVGDPSHPEVLGLAGHASTAVHMINTVEEAQNLKIYKSLVVIGQTTFSKSLYCEICDVIADRFPDAIVYDSICNATGKRQEEVRELTVSCDAIVVVGGKHSANTRRLAEIGRESGKPTFHVETADELQKDDFLSIKSVGVTAGASTPGWMTQHVIDRLETFSGFGFFNTVSRIVRLAARARLTTAIGAGLLCHAVFSLNGISEVPLGALFLAAGYIFVAYTLNRREPPEESTRLLVPVDRFFREHKTLLVVSASVVFLFSMWVAYLTASGLLVLMGSAFLFSFIYTARILPHSFRRRRMKDFPASKDMLAAVAWAVVISGVEYYFALNNDSPVGWKRVACSAGIVFILALAKTVMLDLRDIESDRLIGIETLPVVIGRRRAARLVYITYLGLLVLLAIIGFSGVGNRFFLLFCVVPVYGAFTLYQLNRSRFRGEVNCQLAIDSQLFLAGILSMAWRIFQ